MFPLESTTLRPRPWPSLLLLVFGVILVFIPQTNNEQMARYFGLGLIGFAAILWFLISRARIIIDDSKLTHKTIFVTKEIFWDRVSRTVLKYRHHGKSGSWYWYFEDTSGKKEKFSVNLYSRKSLRAIAETITTKCRNADIEKRIYNMAEGQFPWYIW